MTSLRNLLLCVVLMGMSLPTFAVPSLQVAVAANFSAPIQHIKALFEQETGEKISVSLGSTGRFYAQISNGAPFDVLLAADGTTAAKLIDAGHAKPSSNRVFATGRLVLWSSASGFVDKDGAVLASGRFKRLAIADPKLAPYGAAAIATLKTRKLHDSVVSKLVQGESIAQAYQFVATGNAELGLLALSQVWANGKLTSGSAWVVPSDLHAPLVHEAVLLKPQHPHKAADRFLAFLATEPAKRVLRQHGYSVP